MYFYNIKTKVDCCFAKQVYNEYLHKRYGINNCVKTETHNIDTLGVLKNTYNYYTSSVLTNPIMEVNTGNLELLDGECNISNLIEKINLL